MIEYLNRETVLKELDRNSITKKITLSDGVSIYDSIQRLPTADVVEVVRCKDCKKRYVPYYCALWHSTVNGRELFLERGDSFFCSHGERKEQ